MNKSVTGNRLVYLDIAKGIGIILVVWAHAGGIFHDYIIQMHMPLFFLVSGLLYKNKKTLKDFTLGKITALYIPFVFWNLLAVIIHSIYSKHLYYKSIILVLLTLTKDGQLFGATWFLAALLQVTIAYRLMDMLLSKIKIVERYKALILLIFFILFGVVGFCINFPLYFSRTLVLSMFFSIGAFAKSLGINFEKKWYKSVIAILLFSMFAVIACFNHVKMSANEYSFHLLFVFGALAATYSTLYLTKVIESGRNRIICKISDLLSYVGKNSIDILIWHFVAFRIVIVIQLLIDRKKLTINNIFQYYPYYDNSHGWWIVYLIIGIITPLLICALIRKTKVGKLLNKKHIL